MTEIVAHIICLHDCDRQYCECGPEDQKVEGVKDYSEGNMPTEVGLTYEQLTQILERVVTLQQPQE